MQITPITSYYINEKIPDIIRDYQATRKSLGVEPSNIENNINENLQSATIKPKEKDNFCAEVLTSMAILKGPTDVDEIFSAIRQIKYKEREPFGYDPKIAQHPFSFFRRTVLHDHLNPNSPKCVDVDLANYIINKDISLLETKPGKWILDRLGVIEDESNIIQTNIKDIPYTEENKKFVTAKRYISKTRFGDLTMRALARTPVFGIYTIFGINTFHAVHEIAEGKDAKKEIAKAGLKSLGTILGTGYLGAIGYKHGGAIGSLLGMTLGTAIGSGLPVLAFELNSEVL